MSKPKYKKLEINCDRLTTGTYYRNGSYCSAGHYYRKVEGLPPGETRTFFDNRDNVLDEIVEINDDEELSWKEKAKLIRAAFKKIGVLCTFKRAWWI